MKSQRGFKGWVFYKQGFHRETAVYKRKRQALLAAFQTAKSGKAAVACCAVESVLRRFDEASGKLMDETQMFEYHYEW